MVNAPVVICYPSGEALLGTRFKSKMQTLMTVNFQLFSKAGNCAA